jgi:nicotinamidase-related amidase
MLAAMGSAIGSALVVIDMQNDFCEPGAPLCVRGAAGCLPLIQTAVAAARAADVPVVWVLREHAASGEDAELSRRHLFHPGGGGGYAVAGSRGAALVDGLSVAPGEAVVTKKRFSAFHATNLVPTLTACHATRLVLAGVQTPNCIRATAYDALALDYPSVVVLSDATGSSTPFVQEANLYDIRYAGAEVMSTQEWIDSLGGDSSGGGGGGGEGGAADADADAAGEADADAAAGAGPSGSGAGASGSGGAAAAAASPAGSDGEADGVPVPAE